MSQLRHKTGLFTVVVVLTNVLGNSALKWGMERVGDPGVSPLLYLKAIFNPGVMLGIALLIVWMLSRMTLLSWADLSYVLPVTSIGYVLVAIAGRVFLHEQITVRRWAGITLIMAGVALVSGGTPPQTMARPRAKAAVGAHR